MNFSPSSIVKMKYSGAIASFLCVVLPLVVGAPANEDGLKQQISSGYLRDDYWSPLTQELYAEDPLQRFTNQYNVRTRGGGLDSLGHGNILRSLDGLGNDWSDFNKGSGWRVGYGGGSPKRGGGLDSLGRGNILRKVNYDDEVANLFRSFNIPGKMRSLDSLGKGNILKRSVRVA